MSGNTNLLARRLATASDLSLLPVMANIPSTLLSWFAAIEAATMIVAKERAR